MIWKHSFGKVLNEESSLFPVPIAGFFLLGFRTGACAMALSDVDDLSEPKPQWLESGKTSLYIL